ncbi:MAG: hypothetical protein E6G64_03270 [Actinobacteria bacterium]|nr:MAG: hypothetical protein E6G64_03270 [Actinomycetota bacterium]
MVPFGVDHPQIPRLKEALARFGFVALIHWSPAMRDRRLVPEDTAHVAAAYDYLLRRPDVDATRSGLFGTCVGGSFALLAAAEPVIRDHVAFVGAFAPYSSLWTFVRDIASRTRADGGAVAPWVVDPLTHEVFVRSVTETLPPREGDALREAYSGGTTTALSGLSVEGQAVERLLAAPDRDAAELALRQVPQVLRERLDAMSPLQHIGEIRAPLIMIGHDRDDLVIPVGESRRASYEPSTCRCTRSSVRLSHSPVLSSRIPSATLRPDPSIAEATLTKRPARTGEVGRQGPVTLLAR